MKYNWNWGIFWDASPEGTGTYGELLIAGLGWTIATALCAWAIALVVGTTVGVMRTLPPHSAAARWANILGAAWVELFRNIPILVQLFLWFYVVPELLPKAWGTAIKQMPNSAFVTAVVGLGFATSARVAEQLRAGLQSLPPGQGMAASALGLTLPQAYRHVLLPRAFRVVLPPLTSEFLNLIKNTSVGLTIGLLELTSRARSMQEYSAQVFEAFTAATLLYLMLNLIVVTGVRALERRVSIPGQTGS